MPPQVGINVPKRICIFSDGTWQSTDTDTPTNIRRLSMALRPHGADGVPQVQIYDAGVGTEYGVVDLFVGGAFGDGIDLNIKQLYVFLALNYCPGDEVYVFGYSRGAYTVRSLIGLINMSGLVRRNHVDFTNQAYALYRRNPGVDSAEALAFRETHGESIPVKLVACFDTVGALGIPNIFPEIVNQKLNRNYQFHNTVISPNVELAVQALSIGEWKGAFMPTLMEPCDADRPEQVVQFYCWGDHEGVGGGNRRKSQSAYCALRAVVTAILDGGMPLAFDDLLFPGYDLLAPVFKPTGVVDVAERVLFGAANVFTGSGVRHIASVHEVHETAIRRYAEVPGWRPAALRPLHDAVLKRADEYELLNRRD